MWTTRQHVSPHYMSLLSKLHVQPRLARRRGKGRSMNLFFWLVVLLLGVIMVEVALVGKCLS